MNSLILNDKNLINSIHPYYVKKNGDNEYILLTVDQYNDIIETLNDFIDHYHIESEQQLQHFNERSEI